MENKLKHYLVTTPAMEHFFYEGYEQVEPPESYAETCFVEAENKEDAKVLSLKFIDLQGWVKECRLNNQNPLVGLKVQDCKCDHNNCWCENCLEEFGECEDCLKELEDNAKKAMN